jgi:hypothetical protein
MVVLGSLLTVLELIFYPLARLLDPRLIVYQRAVGLLARLNLRPYTRVTCKVRRRRRRRRRAAARRRGGAVSTRARARALRCSRTARIISPPPPL